MKDLLPFLLALSHTFGQNCPSVQDLQDRINYLESSITAANCPIVTCSINDLRYTTVQGGIQPGVLKTACFPKKFLEIGDKVTFFAPEPPQLIWQYWWSFNLFQNNLHVGIYYSATGTYGKVYMNSKYVQWATPKSPWNPVTTVYFSPFPYKVNQVFKFSQVAVNDKIIRTFKHRVKNPATDYVWFGFNQGDKPFPIHNITISQGGIDFSVLQVPKNFVRIWDVLAIGDKDD